MLKKSILAFLVSALFSVPAYAWKVEVLAGTLDHGGKQDGKGTQASFDKPGNLLFLNDQLYLSDGEAASNEAYAASVSAQSKGLSNRIITRDGTVTHGGIGAERSTTYDSRGNVYSGGMGKIGRADAGTAPDIHVQWDERIATWVGGNGRDGCVSRFLCRPDGKGRAAKLFDVKYLTIARDDTIYFMEDSMDDAGFSGIRKVAPDGTVTSVAGGIDQHAPAEGACGHTSWQSAGRTLLIDEPRQLLYTDDEWYDGNSWHKGLRMVSLANKDRRCTVKRIELDGATDGRPLAIDAGGRLYLLLAHNDGTDNYPQMLRYDTATGKAGKLFGPEILRAYGTCDFVTLDSARGVFYASCSSRGVLIRIVPDDGDWPSARIAVLP